LHGFSDGRHPAGIGLVFLEKSLPIKDESGFRFDFPHAPFLLTTTFPLL
jgi:hypothetical protein